MRMSELSKHSLTMGGLDAVERCEIDWTAEERCEFAAEPCELDEADGAIELDE